MFFNYELIIDCWLPLKEEREAFSFLNRPYAHMICKAAGRALRLHDFLKPQDMPGLVGFNFYKF
jgi:hypothetical protein